MANPTTYFGWVMPNSADLVTDLPADFAVFGQGVDTSMQYLLGGTTGQVLSKTSATNMAFTWIANDQGDLTAITAGTGISVTSPTGPIPTVAIDATVATLTGSQTLTNKTLTSPALTTPTISTATTNGDLLYGTGSGALARLGIGSSAQILSVSGGIPSWATASSGALTLIVTNSPSGAASTTFDSVFTSTYFSYLVVINQLYGSTNTADLQMQYRYSGGTTDSGATYNNWGLTVTYNGVAGTISQANGTQFTLSSDIGSSSQWYTAQYFISGVGQSTTLRPVINGTGSEGYAGNANQFSGLMDTARSYDGFLLKPSTGTLTGSVSVYGLAK